MSRSMYRAWESEPATSTASMPGARAIDSSAGAYPRVKITCAVTSTGLRDAP